MRNLAALIAGLVFGLGLILSGMSDPGKVQNFFAVFSTWDPSLAFVMIGAIGVALPGIRMITRRERPAFDDSFYLPTAKDLDARLIGGSAVFGLGWGLAGYCPGPAIVNLTGQNSGAWVFVAALLVGTGAAKYALDAMQRRPSAAVPGTAHNG